MTDSLRPRVAFRRRLLPLALGSSLLLAALPLTAAAGADDPAPSTESRAERAAAQVASGLIVRTASGEVDAAQRAVADTVRGAAVASTSDAAGGTSVLAFDQEVTVGAAQRAAARLEAREDVVWAEPDVRRRVTATSPVTTDDPLFGALTNLWDARSLSTTVRFPVGGYSTKAPALWRATKGSPKVTVAVVDTGMTAHPDLAGSRVAGYDFVGAEPGGYVDEEGNTYPSDFYSNDGNGRDPDASDPGDWVTAEQARACYADDQAEAEDSSWHGTHVAGTIGATDGNRIGVVGIAPDVRIQPVRAIGRCGGTDADIVAALTWASGGTVPGVPANATPAKVVNLSLGGLSVDAEGAGFCPRSYQSAIDGARSRGAVVVVSAGNDADDASYYAPANCEGVVTVGATDELGQSTSYTNVGRDVDVSAPGGDAPGKVYVTADQTLARTEGYLPGTGVRGTYSAIASTVDTGRTVPEGPGYARQAGTSMAAPAVSAGAALMFSLGWTRDEVEEGLRSAVAPFPAYSDSPSDVGVRTSSYNCSSVNGADRYCGTGMLDLSKVVTPLGARPTVTGTARVGSTLRAVAPAWLGPARLTVRWRTARDFIGPTSGSTLVVTPELAGKKVYAVVTGYADGQPARTVQSVGTTVAPLVRPTVTLTVSRKTLRSKTQKTRFTARTSLPQGYVIFYDRDRPVTKVRTTNGVAKVAVSGGKLRAGTHRVRAVFRPDAVWANGAHSASVTVKVTLRR